MELVGKWGFFFLVAVIVVIATIYINNNPYLKKRRDRDFQQGNQRQKEQQQEEKRKQQERKRLEILSKIKGNWHGRSGDSLVEVIFENEDTLTVILQGNILSVSYQILHVDEKVNIEVKDRENVSEVSLRFIEDGSGRIHFKSDTLEILLAKKK